MALNFDACQAGFFQNEVTGSPDAVASRENTLSSAIPA